MSWPYIALYVPIHIQQPISISKHLPSLWELNKIIKTTFTTKILVDINIVVHRTMDIHHLNSYKRGYLSSYCPLSFQQWTMVSSHLPSDFCIHRYLKRGFKNKYSPYIRFHRSGERYQMCPEDLFFYCFFFFFNFMFHEFVNS